MPHTIAVALPKGGVGKTTTAVNLAASFALEGRHTLLIDLDPIGSSGASFGFTSSSAGAGLYEAFNFTTSLAAAIHTTELPCLDLIPCNATSLQREERLLRLADNRTLLRNLLRPVLQRYEYIFLDCPPTLRGLTTTALAAADGVLLPVRAGHFSLDAVDRLFAYLAWMREVTSRPIVTEGIVITMHEAATKVSEITLRELSAKYQNHLLITMIPRNSALSEATFYGKPAVVHDPRTRGAEAYRMLARELLARHAATPLPLRAAVMERSGTEG